MTFGAHLDNPGQSPCLEILNAITSAKVPFAVSGDTQVSRDEGEGTFGGRCSAHHTG